MQGRDDAGAPASPAPVTSRMLRGSSSGGDIVAKSSPSLNRRPAGAVAHHQALSDPPPAADARRRAARLAAELATGPRPGGPSWVPTGHQHQPLIAQTGFVAQGIQGLAREVQIGDDPNAGGARCGAVWRRKAGSSRSVRAHVGQRDQQVAMGGPAPRCSFPVGASAACSDPAQSAPSDCNCASKACPAASRPTAVSRCTGRPRRARFSAMLRATPPGDSCWRAGFELPICSAPGRAASRSRLVPPGRRWAGAAAARRRGRGCGLPSSAAPDGRPPPNATAELVSQLLLAFMKGFGLDQRKQLILGRRFLGGRHGADSRQLSMSMQTIVLVEDNSLSSGRRDGGVSTASRARSGDAWVISRIFRSFRPPVD
ncbi:hypothetical protein Ddc_22508 [Ditylenchus destructor]|nr:hypothetical protein Ddc_22508 [Ditylenchus destructor]